MILRFAQDDKRFAQDDKRCAQDDEDSEVLRDGGLTPRSPLRWRGDDLAGKSGSGGPSLRSG